MNIPEKMIDYVLKVGASQLIPISVNS